MLYKLLEYHLSFVGYGILGIFYFIIYSGLYCGLNPYLGITNLVYTTFKENLLGLGSIFKYKYKKGNNLFYIFI